MNWKRGWIKGSNSCGENKQRLNGYLGVPIVIAKVPCSSRSRGVASKIPSFTYRRLAAEHLLAVFSRCFFTLTSTIVTCDLSPFSTNTSIWASLSIPPPSPLWRLSVDIGRSCKNVILCGFVHKFTLSWHSHSEDPE